MLARPKFFIPDEELRYRANDKGNGRVMHFKAETGPLGVEETPRKMFLGNFHFWGVFSPIVTLLLSTEQCFHTGQRMKRARTGALWRRMGSRECERALSWSASHSTAHFMSHNHSLGLARACCVMSSREVTMVVPCSDRPACPPNK